MTGRAYLKSAHMRFSIAVPALFAVLVLAVLLGTSFSSAGPGPKLVRGYIWDTDGRPLEGADVVVNVRKPDTSIRSSQTDTSDTTGFYSVTFGAFDWEIGDTIEVISDYNSNEETNSTSANARPIQYVNVTYPFAISQFGSWVGLVVAGGSVAIVAIVLLSRKKKA